jgi:O-antigen/teichoic acid export membrane protein
MPYFKENISLGVASGLKFFSANLMRYFVAFQFGIVSLGYMTPIFYGLTTLSTVSTIFDNIFSPKLLKTMDRSNKFNLKSHKKEVVILLSTSILIFILSVLFSNYYYNFFFPNNDNGYHNLLIVFSIGWIFYVSRAMLKVVSFKLGLQHLQMKVQLMFLFILAILMSVFSFLFGVIGVALAFVISSSFISIYYFRKVSQRLC